MTALQTLRRPADAGLSLVEVLVTIALSSVVLGLLGSFAVNMLDDAGSTTNRLTNVDQLRVAMDEVTTGLRVAIPPAQLNSACSGSCSVPLIASTSSQSQSVTFYASNGSSSVAALTTYEVEQDPFHPGTGVLLQLQNSSSVPTGLVTSTSCGTGCATRTLASGLAWPLAQPAFQFAGSDCGTFAQIPPSNVGCVSVDLQTAGARNNPGSSTTSTVFLQNSVIGQ